MDFYFKLIKKIFRKLKLITSYQNLQILTTPLTIFLCGMFLLSPLLGLHVAIQWYVV